MELRFTYGNIRIKNSNPFVTDSDSRPMSASRYWFLISPQGTPVNKYKAVGLNTI